MHRLAVALAAGSRSANAPHAPHRLRGAQNYLSKILVQATPRSTQRGLPNPNVLMAKGVDEE